MLSTSLPSGKDSKGRTGTHSKVAREPSAGNSVFQYPDFHNGERVQSDKLNVCI